MPAPSSISLDCECLLDGSVIVASNSPRFFGWNSGARSSSRSWAIGASGGVGCDARPNDHDENKVPKGAARLSRGASVEGALLPGLGIVWDFEGVVGRLVLGLTVE